MRDGVDSSPSLGLLDQFPQRGAWPRFRATICHGPATLEAAPCKGASDACGFSFGVTHIEPFLHGQSLNTCTVL